MKYLLKINSKTYQIERKTDGYYCDGIKLLDSSSKELQDISVEQTVTEDGSHFKIKNQYLHATLEKVTDHLDETKKDEGIIKSPLNGIVYAVDCQCNCAVKKGDKILTIEAMKMLYPFYAANDGVVTFCEVVKGSLVKTNQVLIVIKSS